MPRPEAAPPSRIAARVAATGARRRASLAPRQRSEARDAVADRGADGGAILGGVRRRGNRTIESRAMPSLIAARMAATPEMLACFDDAALVAAVLRFERELAAVLGERGIISAVAAAAVAAACEGFDASGLDAAAAHAGTLAIPLVARLRAAVPAEHAAAVHRGATSQDVADTALALQVAAAAPLLLGELDALADRLASLARDHAAIPALGRTLLQPAELISAGARAATWMLGIDAAAARLRRELRAASQIALGGAVGTLSALGEAGPAVRDALAARLGLASGPSWHSRRDAIAGLGAAIGITVGALGKLARDVSLLMQPELGELAEPAVPGRGGSSAMPHKRNPTGCQVALSAAIRAPGLVASLLGGLPQELERGLGGWQAEAPVIADLFGIAHGAARAMREVADGLEVHTAAITAHADAAAAHTTIDPTAAVAAAARFVDEALSLHTEAVAQRPRRP